MPPEQSGNPFGSLLIFVYAAIFMIWYFLVIKPNREKQNQQKKMLTNLKKNDEVVTVGGIHGTIVNVKETTVIVRIDDNVKMEVDKEAVTTITKVAG
ncbi:MAG TPA: preprotein translocase subunit YajC [Candidatus Omnitrophota bacterium]|nr:preprotein translocase subunit YajC [Candidatus Omnitrophota bacterium]HPD85292.1 preprotein translocase subunit YajC [Candidatus Omnitrophota bacterium]HRZ04207.1 preprotein translocase subunit YajC [Candidatus Omnitrophota bacterium]